MAVFAAPMDMLVDFFFLVDLALRFLFGVVEKGKMITSMFEVANRYIRTTFLLDCFASIPVAWIEFATVANVDCESASSTNSPVKYLRLIRLLRMIRIFKVSSFDFRARISAISCVSVHAITIPQPFSMHCFPCQRSC